MIHELFEIDEIVVSTPDAPQLRERMKRMQDWILNEIMNFHACVQEVESAVNTGAADGSLSLLMTESGYNILTSTPTFPVGENASEEGEVEEDETENDNEDEEDSYDPNCYAFYSEDSYPVGLLIAAIRRLAARPDITAETAENLKVFLFAMERLPLVTPGVRMSLGLRLDQGGESDWIEIRMEDGEFTLGRGTWTDGDADTETDFEVTADYREGDAFIATGFAESFAECARDVCREVVIEDTSEEPFTGWNLERDKTRWASLPCSFL